MHRDEKAAFYLSVYVQNRFLSLSLSLFYFLEFGNSCCGHGEVPAPVRLRVGGEASRVTGSYERGPGGTGVVTAEDQTPAGTARGPGRVGSRRAGGGLRAGQRGLPGHGKAVASTQAVWPAEPHGADVSDRRVWGAWSRRPAWTAADVPGEARLPVTKTWCRKRACHVGSVSLLPSVPTTLVKSSEKRNHSGSQCVKISQLRNSRVFIFF